MLSYLAKVLAIDIKFFRGKEYHPKMKFTSVALALYLTSLSDARSDGKKFRSKKNSVCFLGCTPYVNPLDPLKGINKYKALVADMADNCDLIMNIGDTKAGAAPCNKGLMTDPLHILVDAAKAKGAAVMYAIGDNEMNDCHRDGSKVPPRAADYYKAADARQFVLSDMSMDVNYDLDVTGVYRLEAHYKNGTIPGTTKPYSCDFDKLMVTKDAVVITLEIPGSEWFLADQRNAGYPNQDSVDPLAGRLSMYLNAKDCALEWITHAAEKATSLGKRAVIIGFQAHFWEFDSAQNGYVAKHINAALDGIGEYYNATNLAALTQSLTGTAISEPFAPLYSHMTATAKAFPNLMFYTINSDNHVWVEARGNAGATNTGTSISSHHNWMIHQIEGDSRALTMYTQIRMDADAFEPIQVNQVWSKKAYDTIPVGHTYFKYV